MNARQKNLATVVGLLAVAVTLGLYAWFGVMKGSEREAETKELSEQVFVTRAVGERSADGGALPAPDFDRITVTAKGDTTTIERRDAGWVVTSPLQTNADENEVSTLTFQLGNSKFKSVVEEKPTDAELEQFGLKPPKTTVKAVATVKGKPQELTLYGGIENTYDGSIFVRREGDPKVYAGDGALRFAMEKSTFDLRGKDVFAAVDEPKLSRVRVKTEKNRYAVERGDKGWKLVEPSLMPADTQAVTLMLGTFKNELARAYPQDMPENRKKFGLDRPQQEIEVTAQDGTMTTLKLSKTKVDGADHVYALRDQKGQTLLAELAPTAFSVLDKSTEDLRDKTVLEFKRDDVARVVVKPEGSNAEIVVVKTPADGGDDSWMVTAPRRGPAKRWKLSSMLWTLGALKATAFDQEAPKDWARFGIDTRSRTVTLFDSVGKELARLTLGKSVPGKTNTVYVRGTKNQVLEMSTEKLVELPASAADVLDQPAATGATLDAGTVAAGIPPN